MLRTTAPYTNLLKNGQKKCIPDRIIDLLAISYIIMWRKAKSYKKYQRLGNDQTEDINVGRQLLGYSKEYLQIRQCVNRLLDKNRNLDAPCNLDNVCPQRTKRPHDAPANLKGSKKAKTNTAGFKEAKNFNKRKHSKNKNTTTSSTSQAAVSGHGGHGHGTSGHGHGHAQKVATNSTYGHGHGGGHSRNVATGSTSGRGNGGHGQNVATNSTSNHGHHSGNWAAIASNSTSGHKIHHTRQQRMNTTGKTSRNDPIPPGDRTRRQRFFRDTVRSSVNERKTAGVVPTSLHAVRDPIMTRMSDSQTTVSAYKLSNKPVYRFIVTDQKKHTNTETLVWPMDSPMLVGVVQETVHLAISEFMNLDGSKGFSFRTIKTSMPLWLWNFIAKVYGVPRCESCSAARPVTICLYSNEYLCSTCNLFVTKTDDNVDLSWRHQLDRVLKKAYKRITIFCADGHAVQVMRILETLTDAPWMYGVCYKTNVYTNASIGQPPIYPIMLAKGDKMMSVLECCGIPVKPCTRSIDREITNIPASQALLVLTEEVKESTSPGCYLRQEERTLRIVKCLCSIRPDRAEAQTMRCLLEVFPAAVTSICLIMGLDFKKKFLVAMQEYFRYTRSATSPVHRGIAIETLIGELPLTWMAELDKVHNNGHFLDAVMYKDIVNKLDTNPNCVDGREPPHLNRKAIPDAAESKIFTAAGQARGHLKT